MTDHRSDNNTASNLVTAAESGMLQEWVGRFGPKRWDNNQFLEIYHNARDLFGELDRADFGQLLEDLHAHRHNQPRRFSRPITFDDIYAPQTQASGALAHPAEVAEKYRFEEERGSLFLGRCPMSGTPIGYEDERHAIMFCQTRSGKGTGVIIPNHLFWPGSLVSLDPKGENATISAARRGLGNEYCIGMKQKVCVLDPFRVADVEDRYRCSYNPLDELDPNELSCQRKALAIAEAMVVRSGRESEEYWKDEPVAIMHAIILHVVSSPQFDKCRNLITVRQLIRGGDTESLNRLRQECPDRKAPDPVSMLFSVMMDNPSFRGVIADKGRRLLEMKINGERQWVGVDSGLDVQTRWLDDPEMQSCLTESSFKLSEFKDNPDGLSVYLCLPERDTDVFKRWQRIVINQIAYELRGSRKEAACGHRLLMCLDEFATLDRLQTFENGVSHFAGYGIRLLMVFQDIAQLQKNYPDSWQTFLGNSSTKIFFDIDNPETQELAQKMAGQIELLRQTATRGVASGTQGGIQVGSGSGVNASAGEQNNTSDANTRTSTSGSSDTNGDAYSRGRNTGRGGSHTDSSQYGYAENASFERPRIVGRNLLKSDAMGWFRNNETLAMSKSGGGGSSDSTSWSDGKTVSHTSNKAHTDSRSESLAQTQTTGSGTNRQVGIQQNSNLGVSLNHNQQQNAGLQEVFQLRHLFQLNELRRYFGKITDRRDPLYPGLALVFVGAEDPAILRRVNYYED